MTFFINGIKLTTIYASNVGFSSSAGICLFHFAFYLNLGSKINVLARLEISIHHQPVASGKISVWEIMRAKGASGCSCMEFGTVFGGGCVLCSYLSLVLYNVS